MLTGSYSGLYPVQHQAIIYTNTSLLPIRPWGKYLSEILLEIQKFSLKKMPLMMPSANWQPFCLIPSVLSGFHGQTKAKCQPLTVVLQGILCFRRGHPWKTEMTFELRWSKYRKVKLMLQKKCDHLCICRISNYSEVNIEKRNLWHKNVIISS